MTTETITYRYSAPSAILPTPEGTSLVLSSFSENEESTNEQLFWGRLLYPQMTARCLTTLAAIVHSRFTLTSETIAAMHDPIISVGNGSLRFEGFSSCAGIYARVDVLPKGLDGEFTGSGTTNVDFNSPMLAGLGGVRQKETVLISVGQKEVAFGFDSGTVIERKVPLPQRWLKGLTSVQHYLASAKPIVELNRVQALRLMQSVPRGKTKSVMYLNQRGRDVAFSPMQYSYAVGIGGIERLRLLDPLIPHIDTLQVFASPSGSATVWLLYCGPLRFCFTLSCTPYRGFSGEGAGLDALVNEISTWLPAAHDYFDAYGNANQLFSPDDLAQELLGPLDSPQTDTALSMRGTSLAQCMAAMGLLGYDLDARSYFYRKLPYKAQRVLSLNPRLKNALKLVEKGQVTLVPRTDGAIEGRVAGSDVWHTVVLNGESARCTCAWMGQYGGSRGPCKHILAVKKFLQQQ